MSTKNFGISITNTCFNEGDFFGEEISSQNVGTIGLSYKDYGLNFSNDFLGDRQDRWRTFAAEFRYKDYSIGVMAGTNNGKKESEGIHVKGTSSIYGEWEQWPQGKVYFAPLWLGYRDGGQITRIGYSASVFQDATQNGLHYLIYLLTKKNNREKCARFFLDYSQMYKGWYSYRGFYNPDIIWAR